MTNKEYQQFRAKQFPQSLLGQLKTMVETYSAAEGCGTENAIRDVLTDIRHLCDIFELSFDEIDSNAQQGYLEELEWRNDEAGDRDAIEQGLAGENCEHSAS